MSTFAVLSADWQRHAACRAVDGDAFFPPPYTESRRDREAREARAKAVCADCPVVTRCLEWALVTREQHGVWGGCSESERRQILAGKRPVPPSIPPGVIQVEHREAS